MRESHGNQGKVNENSPLFVLKHTENVHQLHFFYKDIDEAVTKKVYCSIQE